MTIEGRILVLCLEHAYVAGLFLGLSCILMGLPEEEIRAELRRCCTIGDTLLLTASDPGDFPGQRQPTTFFEHHTLAKSTARPS